MAEPHFQSYSGNSELVFFDDFNSGRLDRTNWNVRATGRTVNSEQQAYLDAEETVSCRQGPDGHSLVLQAHYRPGFTTPEGNRFDFVSGRIDTRDKVEFTYGTASARMKLPVGTGLWPAFWALGSGTWPASGEIDIMEYIGEPDWVSAAVHGPNYSGESGLVNLMYFPPGEHAAQWHEYSVDWQPHRMEFFVDGRLSYRVTRPMVEFNGEWAFDNPKYLILNFALGGTFPFKVNGIRQPYYGLSEDAVEVIKTGGAKVLVDWVRITRPLG